MREIIFRALYRGAFVYGNLIKGRFKGVEFHEIEYSDSEDFHKWQVDPETVGQFVSLNGKEVYEGDIVQIVDNYGSSAKYVIEYNADVFCIVGQGGPGEWLMLEDLMDCEVIGNIHENPELIN